MTIDISDNDPRIEYAVAQGVTQTVFTVPFEFFEDSDVRIYVDGVLKSLGSDYTLSGGDGSTGTATFVTATPPAVQQVTGATGGSTVSVVRHVSLERTTDFPAGQEINRAVLNEQLDTITAQIADLDNKVDRTIHLNDYEVAPSTLLTEDRKGKTLAFNLTTGAVEAGPLSSDVAVIADNITAILAVNGEAAAAASSATAAATSETNAGTSETAASGSATASATSATNSATSASGAAASASAASTSETNAATSETNAATSETNAANSATAASSSKTAAATSETNASTSETNAATSATSAATSATASATSATAAAASEAGVDADRVAAQAAAATATTKASEASTSETNAATSASTASTKASEAATSATNAATSATESETAKTAAEAAKDAALAALDSFDDRYLGAKASDPTLDNDGNALVAGALYYNTTDDVMKVYEGSVWVAAYASLSGALLATNNLSDLVNVTSARTNLGLGTNDSPTLGGLTVDGTDTEVLITEDSEGSATLRFADTQADPSQSYAIEYDTSSNKANFRVNDTQRANFNSSGDYMVGPATTVSPFVIYGGNNDATKAGVGLRQTGYIAAARMSDHAMMLNRMGTDGLTMGIRNDGTFVGGLGNIGGELTFHSSTSAEAMRIDSSGNLGIGTTNPSTALDVNGTVTATSYAGDGSALTGVARKVWESSQGSGTSTNYWAKVATYSISGNYDDGSFIYHFVPEEFGAGMPAIVAVNVRRNNGSGGDNHTLNIQLLAKPHANPFSDDSFKLIDDGGATDIELWVKKNDNNGQIVMYEMSAHVEDSTFTIAYNQNAAWQSSEPTGTGLNIKTTGVKVAGNFTATAFAGDGSALTGLATAAQGALADTSVQPNDSPTFAGLTTTANVSFGDNDKALFGDGNDLQIYHSGAASVIEDVGTGDLVIKGTDLYLRSAGNSNRLYAGTDTRLYYDGSEKIRTKSTGVDVTGTVTATSYTEGVYAVTGTTPALDPVNGTIQTWTLSANSTPTESFSAGESMTLMIEDGTAYTITWPTITWVNNQGTAPTLATTGKTVIALWKVSTTLYGSLIADGS